MLGKKNNLGDFLFYLLFLISKQQLTELKGLIELIQASPIACITQQRGFQADGSLAARLWAAFVPQTCRCSHSPQ